MHTTHVPARHPRVRRALLVALAAACAVAPVLLAAQTLTTFSNGTVADATQVNANFTALSGSISSLSGTVSTLSGTVANTPVQQTRIYSDYTCRSTASGAYYYFGAAAETGNVLTPYKADSIILISINYFGEANTHDVHTRLEYRIGTGAWTAFDLVSHGQQGTLKVGAYPDADYNSTPHNHSTQVAKVFNTTQPIYFRMLHFNGGTFWHNCSVSSAYETGPSTLVLQELSAAHATYVKR